jgi:hypothetical protein
MEQKTQTQITEQNRNAYREQLYQQNSTVDIGRLTETTVIAIDCQGYRYQAQYPSKTVLALETMSNVADFCIPRQQFYKFIDNRQYNQLGWPKVDAANCAVLFDCSPILKYRSVKEISQLLSEVSNRYLPSTMIVNLNLMHVDDSRLTDRFYNMSQIQVDQCVVQRFVYDADQKSLLIEFCRKIML